MNNVPKTTHTSQANSAQLQAIHATVGPLLIIAGPGSGKTYTLVERVVHLITRHQVAPENVLVVTFTDKAAQELATRISNRLLDLSITFNLNEMYLGTFHSICLRLLEEHREFTRLKRNFILMDQFDQQYFLYRRLSDYLAIKGIEQVVGESEKLSRWVKSEKLLAHLNKVTEEALDPAVLEAADHSSIRVLGQCYSLYLSQLAEDNALDFATIQREALTLLREHPSILHKLHQQLTYLMVDEYQDTNTIQEQILLLLAGDQPNVCVVGDDDQGLYRFRGATIRNILEFGQHFQGQCKRVTLTTNYRSHPDIVRFYNRWMNDQDWMEGKTSFRYAKNIEARPGEFVDMPCVIRVHGLGQDAWNSEVLAFLHRLKESGKLTDWNQVAFLFRSVKNDKVTALAQFLETNGIAVYSPRSNQFFEREEIKLMIGALIFMFPQFEAARQTQSGHPLKIWTYYDEQCFKPFVEQIKRAENVDLLNWLVPLARQHMNLVSNADYAFSGLFYRLLRFPLFSRYLDENLMSGVKDSRPMRNLAVFSQLLGKFEYLHHISVLTPEYLNKNLRDLFNQFLRFLSEGGINEYEDDSEYAPSGCVSFLTVHQSKGLEFPVVLVGSLDAVPRKQHTEIDEVLEQGYLSKPPFEPLGKTKVYDFYRLYYTAFSRAQNLLVLTYPEKQGRGRTPSKYFVDYVQPLPSWRHANLKLDRLVLDAIKSVNIKREYSFTSDLTLYENCSEQYRFFKALEFSPVRTSPILFGTLVHQTIEDIHKTVLRGETDQLSEEQIERWFDSNYHYLTKRERVYLANSVRHVALGHVLHYYQRQRNDWSRIREAEVDVSLVKDEYILKGSVDLIQGEGNTVDIVDFKSEKKPDVNSLEGREKINSYRRQLEVYAHIVEQRFGLTVGQTHLYYTSERSGNPYISFDKNSHSIQTTIATFDDVVSRIERHDFQVAERPINLCPDCDIRYYCDAKNWQFK